jgi:hypothetical protein
MVASGGDISPVADRIGQLLRLLSSSVDGEVVAAARALGRTLKSVNADFHVLAASYRPNGKLPEAEIKRIYDTGFADGLAAAQTSEVVDDGSWHGMALFCQQRNDRLREREQKFIAEVAAQTVWRDPTEKQQKWLKSIYLRLGGRV